MSRRVLHLAAPASTATLALVGAAWAATGRLPLTGGEARAPLAISARAAGPLVANDRDGRAILSADALRPGVPVTGEVTIGNAGDAPGAFTLSSGGVTDGPGGLSAVLDLTVRDLTTGANVYAGKLASFARVPLGTFGAGAARRYRFELAYPAGRTATADNVLQGATTSVTFNWDAVAVPATTTPTTPAPATPAPAPAPPAPAPAASPAAPVATPPAPTVPVPATPTPAPAAAPRLALGPAPKSVVKGHLVTWMTSTSPVRARVTGSVTVSGRRYTLAATTVALTAKRRTVRLRLPRQAAGRGRRLTVRLVVSAGTGRGRVTLRRTLRVRTP